MKQKAIDEYIRWYFDNSTDDSDEVNSNNSPRTDEDESTEPRQPSRGYLQCFCEDLSREDGANVNRSFPLSS